MKPKYKVGQMVHLTADGLGRPVRSSVFEVVRVRPFNEGEYHYFVKSRTETHERCVREGQLTS